MLVKVLEWLSYRTVKKNYDDMLSRFHLIPERNRRTDRRTHLLYQYRASVCWRAIKIQSRFNFRQFDNKLFAVYSKMILQPYEMQMTDSLLLCLSLVPSSVETSSFNWMICPHAEGQSCCIHTWLEWSKRSWSKGIWTPLWNCGRLMSIFRLFSSPDNRKFQKNVGLQRMTWTYAGWQSYGDR